MNLTTEILESRLRNGRGQSYKEVMEEYENSVIGQYFNVLFCRHRFAGKVCKRCKTTRYVS